MDGARFESVSFASMRLRAIDLVELDARASLRTRFDRKYLLDERTFSALAPVVLGPTDDWRVLTIDGRTEFGYSTVYFDRDLMTYHHHQQGRRRRFKVRVRTYADSTESALEFKTRTGRGQTDKRRRERSGVGTMLEPDEIAWVDGQLASVGVEAIAGTLEASVAISYRRTTLVDTAKGERLTIDRDIVVASLDADGRIRQPTSVVAGAVIVEVKTERPRSDATRRLQQHQHRPMRLSKYCLGVAAIDPRLDRGMHRSAVREMNRLAERRVDDRN